MLTTPDHDDAVTSPPAPAPVGSHPQGFYQDCDPATGRAGTIYRAEEFNELAANLRAFLTAAGITPTKGLATMLRDALHRLYAGHATAIAATQALTPDHAGLVTVNATAAPVVLTLPAASAVPSGVTFQIVRAVGGNSLTIRPAGTDTILGGVVVRDDGTPSVLRSDGISVWQPLGAGVPALSQPRTLQVSPSGVASPTDPFGGTPFNSVGNALFYLNRYQLRGATAPLITINVAAGTYTSSGAFSWDHPQGTQVAVVGAGSGTTVLRFLASSGLVVFANGITLQKIKLQGDGNGPTTLNGIELHAAAVRILDDVVVEGFAGTGVQVSAGSLLQIFTALTVNTCALQGIRVDGGAMIDAAAGTITVTNCGTAAGALAAIVLINGTAVVGTVQTQFGQRGFYAEGPGAFLKVAGDFKVFDSAVTASAVWLVNGACVMASGSGKIWQACNAAGTVSHTYLAQQYGSLFGNGQMVAGNRPLTSPAINTLGNTQAFIVP
jgi:hypothetical protein